MRIPHQRRRTVKTDPPAKTKVLLLDDHQIVRQGIARIINLELDMEVCGEAGSAGEALSRIAKCKPDVVITDISMAGMSGIEFLKQLKARFPQVPAVVLSMHDEALYAERALRAGALGFVMKKESCDEILAAIREAITGKIHVSGKISRTILERTLTTAHPGESPVSSLSDRELEIFERVGQGRGSSEIARELHVSVKTVDTHRTHIKAKLNLRNFRELTQHAVRWVDRENGAA